MAGQRSLRRDHYTAGWLAAAQEMLDEKHDASICDAGDPSLYTLRCIGGHNVVIACLPEAQTGTNSTAAVAVRMKLAFKCLELSTFALSTNESF
ncbi:kinesin light chain [Penicillium subrubescens]|uniref:kinesin light chain n=1 Tax=Penicillium subrubescens TaxID=1316194 RepID=UPI002544F1A8|nr:kinesin light chain [Penicillium subrubescens]KAJ5883048.1 kinesin light chain [Penicillium subrubescens]